MSDDLIRLVNLRDLGGGRTTGGGTMRRGLVFRSAALTDLAGKQLEAVRALGIRVIVDLRRNAERAAFPTPWEAIGCADYWCHDYDYSDADHRQKLRGALRTPEDSRASMLTLYAALPYDLAPAYTRLFRAVVAGKPVLFHCAVGKDRTGVAAALILVGAGVARETSSRTISRRSVSTFPTRRMRAAGRRSPPNKRRRSRRCFGRIRGISRRCSTRWNGAAARSRGIFTTRSA